MARSINVKLLSFLLQLFINESQDILMYIVPCSDLVKTKFCGLWPSDYF